MDPRPERPASFSPAYSRRVKAGVVAADLIVVAVAAILTVQGLASDRAANITGQTINVDGGQVMHS